MILDKNTDSNWIFKPNQAKVDKYIKVEKILKGSLNSIPSPLISVKIQIMDGKICLGCKGKTLQGLVNFPANNLNFH